MKKLFERPLRIVTAVAPYDGHDASVLALNRALLACGHPVEVIYLGFNMAADKIVAAAVQEGADAVAVSSYNGGHLQFYPHLARGLKQAGAQQTLLFGGGGGTILPQDAAKLEAAGVERIYGPGRSLHEIAVDICRRTEEARRSRTLPLSPDLPERARQGEPAALSAMLSRIAREKDAGDVSPPAGSADAGRVVIVSGEGGAGKSTLIDELVARLLRMRPERRIAILASDPVTTSGDATAALLADRVRMNGIYHRHVFMRSLSTGAPYAPLHPRLPQMLRLLRKAPFDLVLVETPGIGQAGIDLSTLEADLILAVKTRYFGSELQLEKDQLLHDADLVVLNKADLQGSESAFAELRDALKRLGKKDALFPAIAKSGGDAGIDRLFASLCRRLGWPGAAEAEKSPSEFFSCSRKAAIVPHARRSYLGQIAASIRTYDDWTERQMALLRRDPADLSRLDPACRQLLEGWPQRWHEMTQQELKGQGDEPMVETPNGLCLPRVALPDPDDTTDSLRFLLEEGLPGSFPFVTGSYPLRPASGGETTRQFAGLGGPEESNERLHYLARGVERPRLSIAFDGITLYGADSDDDPASVGKIGEGGVAIDSYEDMLRLLEGFDIERISTSMTINGPAPVILAMYFAAACEKRRRQVETELGHPLDGQQAKKLELETLQMLRGTVQADILKEVQAQNECIFQPDFALRLLGDVQAFFVENRIRRFYSLSISGYHIGEAGATPAQELAFTLANGFTYAEHFLSRGMHIDAFAPNLSFFFRVSHEAEWLAYGAVARKVWAVAMRELYRGNEAAQRLKFHTQTSGRALQAEEWDTLNPVRQTCHALFGLLANSNSLHVDSADEPMTTPGEKYVRQATMIPNYLQEEAEAFVIQNLLSGSYAFRTLLRQLQEQVLEEFERIDSLGGVIAATEQGYQRRAIAESSARYERQRSRGGEGEALRPIVGYNRHVLPAGHPDLYPPVPEVARPGEEVWQRQLQRLQEFRQLHERQAPLHLQRLRQVATSGGNVFAELLKTVRHATLGQITEVLVEVGGRYRKMV